MIELNCDDGTLFSEHRALSYPRMDIPGLMGNFPLEGPFADGRSVIYRVTKQEKWLDYEVEAIVVRFIKGRCSDVTIHLLGIAIDNGKVAGELLITEHLRKCLQSREDILGKSEVAFYPSWGTVTCIFDFKSFAPSVSIHYK